MNTKSQVLQEYIKYKSLSVKSDKIKDIEFYISKFINFRKKKLEDYQDSDLLEFINKISPEYKQGTLNNIKAYTKNFIKWHYVDWSARFRNLDKYCRSQAPPRTYGASDMVKEKDFEKLIKNEESFFWKAYFLTLFYGGCRPIEVCNLKWKDVEFDKDGGAYFKIFSKKNNKHFLKYIPEKASFYLKKLESNGSEWVFYNQRTNSPITKKGAYWRIKHLSKEVLGREIDLLTLRHSIATILYNKEDKKDDDIAKQMGHTKSMKGKYVENDEDMLKTIAKRIYIQPEELPEEKRHALEKELTELKQRVKAQESLKGQLEALERELNSMAKAFSGAKSK